MFVIRGVTVCVCHLSYDQYAQRGNKKKMIIIIIHGSIYTLVQVAVMCLKPICKE